ncbi:MAG: alpha-amylase family protein [Pseudomonadota bacterium]
MPRRQIHIDFHTSEHIPNVGGSFDAGEFEENLRMSKTEAAVLFAKCHHGWSYYDAEAGHRHPNLSFDLLRSQVDAAVRAAVEPIVYLSVGWDERAARENPGWRRILPNGEFHMMLGKNLDPYWSYLCLNTPYKDEVLTQIAELIDRFPEAGALWLDIIREHECCCNHCRASMDQQGLDWTSEADRAAHAKQVLQRYLNDVRQLVREKRPELSVFQNTSMAPRGDLSFYEGMNPVEIEAVPTGGWGYDHFPLSARYLDGQGLPTMGVTTRFHIVWGELNSHKTPQALHAEAATMLAHGSAVCIGDHLDPSGRVDAGAWGHIAEVFSTHAPLQEALVDTRAVKDVGLLSAVAAARPGSLRRADRDCAEDEGALRILSQRHEQFDVLDPTADWSPYSALVLPDTIQVTPALEAKLSAYVDGGGALLLTGRSGLKPDGTFADVVGGTFVSQAPFDVTYVDPPQALKPAHVPGLFSVFGEVFYVQPDDDQTLGFLTEPYFQRSVRAFSGHINTPPKPEPSRFAAAVQRGKTVYLAHSLFTAYREFGHPSVRGYVGGALDLARGRGPLVVSNAPSYATVTLREKHDGSSTILQMVAAPRELRGESLLGGIEVIDSLPDLANLTFSVTTKKAVHRVTDLRTGATVPFRTEGDGCAVDIDRASALLALQLHHD